MKPHFGEMRPSLLSDNWSQIVKATPHLLVLIACRVYDRGYEEFINTPPPTSSVLPCFSLVVQID